MWFILKGYNNCLKNVYMIRKFKHLMEEANEFQDTGSILGRFDSVKGGSKEKEHNHEEMGQWP